MSWQKLATFRDSSVPKLFNLRRARGGGLRVPPTVWRPAAAPPPGPPRELGPPPFIVRSGSPTEDGEGGEGGSRAGQFVSLVVRDEAELRGAWERVAGSLPRDGAGRPRGVVFAQPLVRAERAGVAFFDGFYYERTEADGGNEALTSGRERGEVRRGHLQRGEAWSEWLARLFSLFGRGDRGRRPIDLEYAVDADGPVLLQVRPAAFEVRRNPTLSLANHKEVLGDPPSPFIASVLERAGRRALAFFRDVDPAIGDWDEPYAVELAGRVWMNFAVFFRMMDRWGLPRAFVTAGVGGGRGSAADGRLIWSRFLRSGPRLVRLQLASLAQVRRADAGLEELGRRIEAARDPHQLFDAAVFGLGHALRTNFAIAGVLSGVSRVRGALGVRGRARVVTEAMMEEYEALRRAPVERRAEGLDAWLANYGHRGPLESDPARPRFVELRPLLEQELARAPAGDRAPPTPARGGPLFWIDRRREAFRDGTMRRWQRLRERLLEEGARLVAAGRLDRAEDVFDLRGDDLESDGDWRARVVANREELERARDLELPDTAARDEIAAALEGRAIGVDDGEERRVRFPGIALGDGVFEGRVRKARELAELLAEEARPDGRRLDGDSVLVVPALEPSWAVVFGRVGGVVAELGGELSHASILLREARRPALVDCRGVWRGLADGERIRLDGPGGCVVRLDPEESGGAPPE